MVPTDPMIENLSTNELTLEYEEKKQMFMLVG